VAFDTIYQEALFRLENLNMITIAAMHGYAIGGGLQFALACDLRIGTKSLILALPAVRDGIMPGLAVWRLTQFIGKGRAKRLILGGENLTGTEGYNIGLLDYVCDESEMAKTVETLAMSIAKETRDSTLHSKHMINRTSTLTYPEYMREYASRFRACVVSPDHRTAKNLILEQLHSKEESKKIKSSL